MTAAAKNPEQERVLLPQNVKATNYDLTLEPNFETFKFDGTVVIDLDVKDTSNTVSVNVLEIDIHSAQLIYDGSKYPAAKTEHDEETQTTKFTFDKEMTAGSKAQIDINFTGTLNENMAGFYKSTYKDEKTGETKYIATTQMEPADCRKAFPSFDEPGLKATFDVTLIADKHLTCLSNMDVKSEKELDSGKKAVSFNRTPVMSTYLIAFIVGEFNYVESNLFRIPVRVYTTPGLESQGQFSADLGAKCLKFFEDTFDIPFPLPKMDQVAIHDFAAGAMENWGLVTYRVVDLLFDEKKSGLATKQRVAEVVQHELAHQWFGNLVTMDWWEGLWLNEGFATWMSYLSMDHFFPEWKIWESFFVDNYQPAFSLDGLRSSHPVEVPVKTADEINQIFDHISYAKGSAVLKMISDYLGQDVFLQGVSNYLKKHSYGNTVTTDLWESLSEASGKDIVSVMDTWTKKIGYPVLTITEDGDKIHVKQNRFLTTGDVKPEEDESIYPCFLSIRSDAGVDKAAALKQREDTYELPKGGKEFYKINAEQVGLYRVAYPKERMTKLAENGKQGLLSTLDRAGLVNDAQALATAGYQSTSNLLTLLSSWNKENEYIVWTTLVAAIYGVRNAWKFESPELRDSLKKLQRELVSPMAKELGWEITDADSSTTQALKTLLFGAAVDAEVPEAVEHAKSLFKSYVHDGNKESVNPNLRGNVFAAGVEYGTEADWEALLKLSQTTDNKDEANACLRALGCSEDAAIREKTLGLLLDGTVRAQDIYMPVGGILSTPEGIRAYWKWMTTNWAALSKIVPPEGNILPSMITLGVRGFTKPEDLAAVEEFFSTRKHKGYERSLSQAIDVVNSKISWLGRDREDVKQWLSDNKYL